jgi:hypothetical protein
MALLSFQEFIREVGPRERGLLIERAVSKSFEVVNDGVEIVINITLARKEQHSEIITFLRRVADELSVLEKASASFDERETDD